MEKVACSASRCGIVTHKNFTHSPEFFVHPQVDQRNFSWFNGSEKEKERILAKKFTSSFSHHPVRETLSSLTHWFGNCLRRGVGKPHITVYDIAITLTCVLVLILISSWGTSTSNHDSLRQLGVTLPFSHLFEHRYGDSVRFVRRRRRESERGGGKEPLDVVRVAARGAGWSHVWSNELTLFPVERVSLYFTVT